ncbi:hypothetical protein L9F63_020258, partial [Diploptera punctata]
NDECCMLLRVPPPSPVLPKRDHQKTIKTHLADGLECSLCHNISLDRSPPLQRTRPTLLVHRTTIDLGTDPGSDVNDVATDSGDDSSSWRHHSRNRTKSEFSPGKVSGSKGDMPPELIVTSAQGQVITTDGIEKTPEKQAETHTSKEEEDDKFYSKLQTIVNHKLSDMYYTINKACRLTMLRTATEISQTKQSSLLRSKIWTGIPCTCHEPGIVTHWSGRGREREASLLQACSQKLASMQKQRIDPPVRNRKFNKKPAQKQVIAHLHCKTSLSDTSAGEEIKKSEMKERVKKTTRRCEARCSTSRRMHKDSSNDSSPGDEVESNLTEVKKLLQQKKKLHRWKTIAHANSSKSNSESVNKTDLSSRHSKIRNKPSLKWKFCHAVAAMVTTCEVQTVPIPKSDIRTFIPSPSDSDTDYKPEVPVVRANSANAKKKKKRKSNAGQKKQRRVSSASAVPSTSVKQISNKKTTKTWQQ